MTSHGALCHIAWYKELGDQLKCPGLCVWVCGLEELLSHVHRDPGTTDPGTLAQTANPSIQEAEQEDQVF